MNGIVYLVGAGPGDWRLLTLRGREVLEKADTVVSDHLADERLLDFVPPEAERIYVGKTAGHHTLKQEEINALLVQKAQEGKTVVRLKGGDPFVFGRGSEEGIALQAAGIPFEVVPGISSSIAVPAYAGIPVTDRGLASSFAVVTGHEDPAKQTSSIHWDKLATAVDTLVFVMGVHNLPYITSQLMRYGRSGNTPAALIRWGTRSDQTTLTTTLEQAADDAAAAGIKPPAIFIVGDVVTRRATLRWFERRPLTGLTIGITRTPAQAAPLMARLEELGARCLSIPTICITPPSDAYAVLDQAIDKIAAFSWIVFTSANGVDHFFSRLHAAKKDSRALGSAKIACIGPATAKALAAYGITADIVPDTYRAEALADSLCPQLTPRTSILLVRAEKARAVLPERLKAAGAAVTIAPAYETRPAQENSQRLTELLEAQELSLLTVTSSSTVTAALTLLGAKRSLLADTALACIGPITAATCQAQGLTPALTADAYTIDGLVEKIIDWRQQHHEI